MSSVSISSTCICLWVNVCCGDKDLESRFLYENTDGSKGHPSPHDREDAANVVFLEIFHVYDAGDVAEPEIFDHLVHGGIWENRRFMIYETLYGNACLRQIINQ